MNIDKIHVNNVTRAGYLPKSNTVVSNCENHNSANTAQYVTPPVSYRYNANIHFTSQAEKKLIRHDVKVNTINFEDYKHMKPYTKKRLAKLCKDFDKLISEEQQETLRKIDPNPDFFRIPLQSEATMDEFLNVAKMYSQYKDHPIVCLGRSPKWFLNTSLYMKDGIPTYDFAAFSGRWYWVYDGDFGNNSGLVKMEKLVPTEAEEVAYRKYLKNIQVDPISLVKKAQKSGNKVIITDYIDTGKGMTSFLDLMSRYAKDQGVLDEFAHSFDLVTIGSNEYRQARKGSEYIPDPKVWLPELLEPYGRATTAWGTGAVINQKYHNIDYDVFREMLLNQISNECRSTYYPSSAWTVYSPNKFKTGYIDIDRYKPLIKNLPSNDTVNMFEPVVQAYRNLLNFSILDTLNSKNLLKTVLHAKL